MTPNSNPSHPFNKDRAVRLLRARLLRQLRWYLVAAAIFLARICAPDVGDARADLGGVLAVYFATAVAIHALVFWLSWRKRLRPFRGGSVRVEERGLVIRRPDGSVLFVAPPDQVFGATRKEGRVVSVSAVAEGGVPLRLDAFDDLDGLWREIGRMFERREIEFVSFDQLSESKLFRHVLSERDRLRDLVFRRRKRRWWRAFLDKRIRHDSVPCTLRAGTPEPSPAEKRHSSEP